MISGNLEFRMHNYYNAQCVMGVLALIVKSRAVVWTALRWLMFYGSYLTMTLLEMPSRVTM